MVPLISGGTGSFSHTEEIPDILPDRFEAGTLNLPGIAGLRAALQYLEETGLDAIREHELTMTGLFIGALSPLIDSGRIVLVGKGMYDSPAGLAPSRTGVISLTLPPDDGRDIADIAWQLDADCGIMTRVGLHCAPAAHKSLGTYPAGTIRFSVGYATTEEEIAQAAASLTKLVK